MVFENLKLGEREDGVGVREREREREFGNWIARENDIERHWIWERVT